MAKTSASSQKYWQRVSPEKQKEKRIARHMKRMGLTKAEAAKGLQIPHFPKPRIPFLAQSVVFSSPVKSDFRGIPLNLLEVAGVLTEISPHSADVDNAIRETLSHLEYKHWRLNPISRKKTLIASRNMN